MRESGADTDLIVEHAGHYARLTLNRPAVRNAANLALWRRLGVEVERLAADPGIRALIVTGAGDKAFMAGADVGEFPAVLQDPARIREYIATVTHTFDLMEEVRVPIIAEINGPAIGGGLELAMACDYRVAVPGARFGIPSADVGLAIFYGDIARCVGLVGAARTKEMLIFSRQYSADEALAIGLINEVAADRPQLRARCQELAATVAAKAPLAIASAKRVIKTLGHGLTDPAGPAYQAAQESVLAAWDSAEFKARVDRLMQRRS